MSLSLFYNHVTVIDYAYFHEERGVVGNSLWVHVELLGKVNKEKMIYDFSYAKNTVKDVIDKICDHRFVIPQQKAQRDKKGNIIFSHDLGEKKRLEYKAPEEAFCVISDKEVTEAHLKKFLEREIFKKMPDTVESLELTLETESWENKESQQPYFHYTHGLKEHYGNCQRLFHGHRNKVDVYIEGEKSEKWENYLAQELFQGNIHFVFDQNIKRETDGHYFLEYTSSQGFFQAQLPKEICYVFSKETTVEQLSQEFYKILRAQIGEEPHLKVVAYEGVGKGAISF